MNKTIKFLVKDINKNIRLDKFLVKNLATFTRSQIKKIITSNGIIINKKKITSASEKVRENDEVVITIFPNKIEYLKPKKIDLEILYEDKDIIIVNKPSGLTVHPGAGNKNNTLVNGLIYNYKNNLSNLNGPIRPGIVHRIDKETSGTLVVAKNNFSHSKLSEQFSKHTITRKYLALVWGIIRPLNGKISNYLIRNKKNRQLMSVNNSSGKKAITNYKTIKVFNYKTVPKIILIECILETGRTHQIRVHFSHKGNPLLGDKKYGKKKMQFRKIDNNFNKLLINFNRQALHAKSLKFCHPRNKVNMNFESKLPQDFKKILEFLENFDNCK